MTFLECSVTYFVFFEQWKEAFLVGELFGVQDSKQRSELSYRNCAVVFELFLFWENGVLRICNKRAEYGNITKVRVCTCVTVSDNICYDRHRDMWGTLLPAGVEELCSSLRGRGMFMAGGLRYNAKGWGAGKRSDFFFQESASVWFLALCYITWLMLAQNCDRFAIFEKLRSCSING